MTTCGLGARWLQRPGVCARLSKLVLDHSEPLAVLFREEVVEQGRLTKPVSTVTGIPGCAGL